MQKDSMKAIKEVRSRQMAVIIANMDMPKNCFTVENKRFKYCKLYDVCEYKDLRHGNVPSDCPLKSTDEMINEIEVEIEKNKMNALEYYGLSHALRIINKYCEETTDADSTNN